MGKKFYTPDGFCDTLPGVCENKREAESKLRRLFYLHGYTEIETPGIEYCDIYTKPDFVAEEELYKFTDSKGRLLCCRYDGTIPAARFAATVYRNEPSPFRFSYIENMYRFNQSGGGKQSEFTQAGIELMGTNGSDADAEVIALAIKAALEIGITDLHVSIGQVKLFEGIAEELGMSEDEADTIRAAILAKDSVTIEKFANSLNVSEQGRETLMLLPESQGKYDIIELFRDRVTSKKAIDALENLREILDVMDEYGFLKYVSVDPGLLGSEDYYTGMIFKAYTYEVGFPVISGGRYDNTVGVFGKEMACVGFSLSLTLALTALMRQGVEMKTGAADIIVGYDRTVPGARAYALAKAHEMRESGLSVILDTESRGADALDAYAGKQNIPTSVYYDIDTVQGGCD